MNGLVELYKKVYHIIIVFTSCQKL